MYERVSKNVLVLKYKAEFITMSHYTIQFDLNPRCLQYNSLFVASKTTRNNEVGIFSIREFGINLIPTKRENNFEIISQYTK